MNKNKSKNANEVQQNKKKVPRSASQGTTRKKKQRSSHDSGINFVVNVSSSGTNLNKRIQDEMAKLEDMEKKIRGHKTKARAICQCQASKKASNERKLKHMLEDMIESIDAVRKAPKKRTQKVEANVVTKKHEKKGNCVQDDLKMDSLTDAKDKLINRTIEISTPLRKSALKKPKSAPGSKRRDFLAKNLKFAESLNFGKEVDLHLSISDMKKIVVSPHTTTNKDATDVSKVDIEKDSKREVAHTLHFTHFNNKKFNSVTDRRLSKQENLTIAEENNSFEEAIIQDSHKEKSDLLQENKKCDKPEKKRFYSYLRRGNFTISHNTVKTKNIHVSVQDLTETESVAGTKYINITNEEPIKTQVEGSDRKVASSVLICNKNECINESVSKETSAFPTNLLERSILAVENVLRTINSITKDFSAGKELNGEILKSKENRSKMRQSGLHLNCLNGQHKLNINKSSIKMSIDNEELLRQVPHKKVITLKSPIQSFYASEDMMSRNKESCHKHIFGEKKCSKEDFQFNYDSLNTALNSLRASKQNIKKPCTFCSSYSCLNVTVSQKLYRNQSIFDNVFIEDYSSKTSYFKGLWSSNGSFAGNVGKKNNFQFQEMFSDRLLDLDMKHSRIFPEYNFQKCLSLLGKKFRDFENMRFANLVEENTSTLESKHGARFNKRADEDNKRENIDGGYEVCFKNEHFTNQSETSLESWNRTDVEKFTLKILDPVECKAKSAPEIKN